MKDQKTQWIPGCSGSQSGFSFSAVLSPCGVKKSDLWAAKPPPFSHSYSGFVVCNGMGYDCLSVWDLENPLPWDGEEPSKPRGGHLTNGVTKVPLSSAWGHQDAWLKGSQDQMGRSGHPLVSEKAVSLCVFSKSHRRSIWWGKKKITKITSQHSVWLCWIMTISYASGNSLLPKSLQNDSRSVLQSAGDCCHLIALEHLSWLTIAPLISASKYRRRVICQPEQK